MQSCVNCGNPVEGYFSPNGGQRSTLLSESTQQLSMEQDQPSSQNSDQQPTTPSNEVAFQPSEYTQQQTQYYQQQEPSPSTSDPDKLFPQRMESSHLVFLIIAFLVGAFLAVVLVYPFQYFLFYNIKDVEAARFWNTSIFGPVLEELCKFLPMLFIAFYFSRFVRTRKEGALVGATTGLGFALMEDLIYFLGFSSIMSLPGGDRIIGASFARLISLPFTHVIFSAWWGVAIYNIIDGKRTQKHEFGHPESPAILFLLLACANHIAWNLTIVLLSDTAIDNVIVGVIIVICVVGIPFLLLLRFVIGGSFGIRQRAFNAMKVLSMEVQPTSPQYYGAPPPYQAQQPMYQQPQQPTHQKPAEASTQQQSEQVEWEQSAEAPTQQQPEQVEWAQPAGIMTQQQPQQSQIRCPGCGGILIWVPYYNRWYCNRCMRYI